MTHAIRVHQTGDADQFSWDEMTLSKPGPGDVRIKQTAVGLNYIDVYMRSGLYPLAELPAVIGMEAAGVIEAIGQNVSDFSIGDRVAYCMVPGAYTEARNISAEKLLKLPDAIDEQTAAAMMLKGLTAHYLLFRSYEVKPGDNILVFAAAGGVGLILCQWANHLGANVIACVGSDEKAELAKANGAHHSILYRHEPIVERVRAITHGEGVAVSYDSIGQATFEASLDSLRPFGTLVTYGNVSGPVDAFNLGILASKGSLYVTRPTLGTHVATRELLEEGAERLFDVVDKGIVKISIKQTYPLTDIAQAHRDLQARLTTGSTVLLP